MAPARSPPAVSEEEKSINQSTLSLLIFGASGVQKATRGDAELRSELVPHSDWQDPSLTGYRVVSILSGRALEGPSLTPLGGIAAT
ncbi:hypothetical protein CVT26_001537 [Gymnopilus dilepis]|uniref:Uncharacterized protein n=1 Tax=Gymnopilus dilepis TaxID=231916 RepID=A0A409VU26_9AGAR|nr:hypothetical protein CVT26_001537 [Gymnopilus dilepis]